MSHATPRRLDDVISLAVIQTVLQVERQARTINAAKAGALLDRAKAILDRSAR